MHAWAEVDSKIRYKRTAVPADLQRRIYQLNARLESVDDEVAELLRATAIRKSSYDEAVGQGDLSLALDAYSLIAYIEESAVVKDWVARAVELGYAEPSEKSIGVERVETLLRTLAGADIRDLASLDQLLRTAVPAGTAQLKAIRDEVVRLTPRGDYFSKLWAHPSDIVHLLVLCHADDPALIEDLALSAHLHYALHAVVGRG